MTRKVTGSNLTLNSNSSNSKIKRRSGLVITQEEVAADENKQFVTLRELDKGAYFGEISLMTNMKVTATVFAAHFLTCGQIDKKKFLTIVNHSSELKKRLFHHIQEYKDPLFRTQIGILRNAFIFRNLNSETLLRISYLFKEQRHLRGKVLIRQREKCESIFFIKKGEVEVRFVYSEYDINRKVELGKVTKEELESQGLDKPQVFKFARINAGGYFNLSSALLNKFSLFEFSVCTPKADLLILSADDL